MTIETRATGLETLPDVPSGTHICHFYKTSEDLLSVTLPFIKAGLENHEYCLWVAWEPLDTGQVMQALANVLPDPALLFEGRQFEIASHCTPELQRGLFQPGGFVRALTERIQKAVASGFHAVRIADNLSWHHETDWRDLIQGERAATEALARDCVVALCSYPIESCTGFQMKDIGGAHHYVLVSVGGQCEVINGGLHREELGGVPPETEYKEVFENTLDGMVLLDTENMQGLLANNAAARILGFESAGEMVGLNPFRSFTRRSGQRMTPSTIRGLLCGEDNRVRQINGITGDGREVRLNSVGVRTEYQGRQAELIAVRDMAASRKPLQGPDAVQRPRAVRMKV